MSLPPPPAPGWYFDRVDSGYLRWWDGRAWTEHTSPFPPTDGRSTTEAAPYAEFAPARWAQEEQAITPWARRAIVVYGAAGIVNALIAWASASGFARVLHQLRVIWANRGHEATVPRLDSTFQAWDLPTGLVTTAAGIVFLVWQYRAARTARALGYPARRSPGWGVGSWFVPVVNLWMPYQAIRDCLPPGDDARREVARVWALLIVVLVLGAPLVLALALARPWGLVLLGIDVVLNILLTAALYRVVTMVDGRHRVALART